MNRVLLTFLVLGALAAACTRSFPQPRDSAGDGGLPLLPLGVPCGDAGACSTGICRDGVCCERDCRAAETCNAPGAAGRCVDKPPGTPCDAGPDCPYDFCFDGVCCATRCDGLCMRCNLPSQEGYCLPAPDNTDSRHACPGACSACFGGSCGPVDPGTDPRHECDGGLTCGIDQACHAANGQACTADGDCGAGECVLGVCLGLQVTQLSAGQESQTVHAGVLGSTLTAEGDDAVAVQEVGAPDSIGDVSFDELYLFTHRAGAAWASIPLLDAHDNWNNAGPAPWARPVFYGRQLYVAVFFPDQGRGCGQGGEVCGVAIFPVTTGGALGSPTVLDPATRDVDTLWAYTRTNGDLVVDYSDGAGLHQVTREAATHAFTHLDVPTPSGYHRGSLSPGRLGGQDVYAYLTTSGALAVIDVHGASIASFDGSSGLPSANCDAAALYGPRGYVEDGPLRLTYDCYDDSYAVTIDASSGTPSASFTSMKEGYNPALQVQTLGTMIDGPDPRVVFVGQGPNQPAATVQISKPEGGPTYVLAPITTTSFNAYPVESLEAAATGLSTGVAYSVTNSTETQQTGGEGLYYLRLAP